MRFKFSICLTVCNQFNILCEQLKELSYYKNLPVEIIISDDCSTENIRELVESYHDPRFRYYCTPKNLGHDLNILHGISHCHSDYVFIFRTRDTICMDNFDRILEVIEQFPDAGYYLFSAYYENGTPRLQFRDRVYSRGREAAQAHFALPEHPSGNLYNRRYLDVDLYKRYINEFFDNIYGFTVHTLIRCHLSTKADFVTSSVFGWVYADTLKAADTAVNSSKNGVNIYAPEYCYPRYRCAFEFVRREFPKEIRLEYLRNIVHKNFIFIAGRSLIVINDPRYQVHYSSRKQEISRIKELRTINQFTRKLVLSLESKEKKKILRVTKRDSLLLLTIYPLYALLRNLFIHTPVFSIYKRVLSKIRR